ncbi:MAG: small multi-drug export protein [Candidatus Edwardsbacteria bacterium]|nr:small multi-drug export protein [Candidatus Edwardsbacteria bacterium]MBU1576421.1 small multi-drug export protein [Candidatus Edwardsbacteria bacterium]MBU2463031.1 small multi-drug export protein [Candidatus Edwardsbacteria bacterium]MBU2593827.1 small multi-drug export protein [Candidatus Edwardsbacteria bacterium]
MAQNRLFRHLLVTTAIIVSGYSACWAGKESLIQQINSWGLPAWLVTMIIAMLPIFELRGAIPVAYQLLGIPIIPAVILSVFGNLIPVIPILLFLGPVSSWLRKVPLFDRFFGWLFSRTRSRSDLVKKYEMVGLMLFVAVPLPVTGAWTGAVAAFLFGIKFWPSLLFISLGVLIAAAIVTALVLMGIWGAIIAGTVLSALAVSAAWGSFRKRKHA